VVLVLIVVEVVLEVFVVVGFSVSDFYLN
jgi:hypothetical protein